MPMSWLQFYQSCHLNLDDPAALFLHPILTLASQINSLPLDNQKTLHVLFLGPRFELARVGLFSELTNLCSWDLQHINIHLIGDSVPSTWDTSSITCQEQAGGMPTISLHFYSGYFHTQWELVLNKIDKGDESSECVFAFLPNAGLAAYPQWIPTMKLLISLSISFSITDYNEEALELSLQLIETCGLKRTRIGKIHLNPFREPVKRKQGGNALPSFSNGFLFSFSPSSIWQYLSSHCLG